MLLCRLFYLICGTLLSVVLFSFRLLDGDAGAGGPDGVYNVFKQRKIKLQPLQRICQRYPVVPQCELFIYFSPLTPPTQSWTAVPPIRKGRKGCHALTEQSKFCFC